MDIEKRLEQLEKRINLLEKKIEQKSIVIKDSNDINKDNARVVSPPRENLPRPLEKKPPTSSSSKYVPRGISRVEASVDSELKAVSNTDKNLVMELKDEDIVKNQLVFGDGLILETNKDGSVKEVKVAQRVKRSEVEALITEKDGKFYAVSQYATHKLLDYDIKTKGVLKGFEVIAILPLGQEKLAKVCVLKETVSTGMHNIHNEKNLEVDSSSTVNKQIKPDPRVLENDDLV